MHKFFTSSYDASIYLQQPNQNSGRDEILEVGKLYYGATKDIHRTLIKFDTTSTSASLASGEISGSWKAYLVLHSAKSEEIPLEYTIYANAVSQSWEMGIGTKFDNITSEGVSWYYRDGQTEWMIGNAGYYDSYVSGSDTGSISNGGGGTWYTASMSSQSFSNEPDDVRMDVTNIVKLWLSGSLPNNGFIIHHHTSASIDSNDYGVLKFFSKETNTIYEPKLEIVYDDYSFTTGSLQPVVGSLYDGDYKVIVNNLKNQYFKNTKVRVRVKGRESYPSKSFGTTFSYEQIKSLPAGSTYYQLEDYITGEIIFPFGEYTKVSCDSTSNYFDMDLNSLSAGRVYKLKLKIEEDNISTIIDEKMVFEIIE
jgi:hypothetical protein